MDKAQLKAAFLEEKRELCHSRAKLLLIFGITLVPLFNGLDYVVAKEYFWQFFYLRLINTIENIILFLILVFHKNLSLGKVNLIGSLFCCSVGPMIAYMCRFLGGYESSYYAGIMLLFLLISLVMPWQTGYTIFNCLLSYAAYIFIAYTPDSSWEHLINNSYFLISAMLMGVASTYFGGKLRFKEFSNRQGLKNANEQLQGVNERLLSLDQAKTRFFTNLTHEFRTPLVSLATLLQMIREKLSPDQDLASFLQSSYASLTEMTENINDLLSKTKSEKGFLEMRWSRLDVIDSVRKSVDVFKSLVAKKDLQLLFQNQLRSSDGETLSSLILYVDRFKFKKILNNLLSNALKFTQEGTITIELTSNTTHLILKVQDTGIGIPPNELETVFEPFTQASNNELREVKGTGLGLSIVKDFVKAHHGNISVESRLGQGTCFTILLPLGDEHVDKAKLDLSELVEEETVTPALASVPKSFEELDLQPFLQDEPERANLLIVEDTPQVLQALAYVLKDHYNLHFARDGEDGLAKVREFKPDLIISDIMMPHKNGYELLEAVKQDPEFKQTPFILLTAKVDLESRIKGLEYGADEYISKPFNNLEVRTRVKNLLERKKIEAEFIHAEKMIALGQLVAGISHEILNPISYAKNATANIPELLDAIEKEILPKEEGKKRLQAALARVEDGIRRVCDIASALKGLVRQGSQGSQRYDIHEGLESTLKILEAHYKSQVQIHRQYDLKEKIFCKINQLNQVFLNLLVNATQALQKQAQGNLWITTSKQDDYALITIRDDGPGIPKAIQTKIFDPFFTTKDIGQGTGLGLYISRQIVQEHQGWLSVESTPGQGAQFIIKIPLQQGTGGTDDIHTFHDHIDRGVAQVQYPHRR
jgi:signal transduction histidine kinase